MKSATDQPRPDVYWDYSERHHRLLRLARRLPRSKIEGLARETIRRLSALSPMKLRSHAWETKKTVEHLCTALIGEDEEAAAQMVIELNQSGVAPEDVYLDYMAAAAHRLEVWWEEDRASLWQITVATCRLLAIMRSMGHLFEPLRTNDHKSAVFSGVPGDHDAVGLRMATDIFRKDGWHVLLLVGLQHDELIRRMATAQARVIGLSVGSARSLDTLSKLVVSLHICRPNTPIFLNGHGVSGLEKRLAWMDLAGVSEDLAEAKAKMNYWVETH